MAGGRASNIDKLGTILSPIYSGQKGDTENRRKYQLQAQNMQDAFLGHFEEKCLKI